MGIPTIDSDVEHFHEAMGLLKNAYDQSLLDQLRDAFDQGFTERKLQLCRA